MLDIIQQLVGRTLDIEQPVHLLAIDDMGLNDFLDILGLDLDIGGVVGHNPDNGSLGTETETPGSDHIDLAAQTMVGNSVDKPVYDLETSRAVT